MRTLSQILPSEEEKNQFKPNCKYLGIPSPDILRVDIFVWSKLLFGNFAQENLTKSLIICVKHKEKYCKKGYYAYILNFVHTNLKILSKSEK